MPPYGGELLASLYPHMAAGLGLEAVLIGHPKKISLTWPARRAGSQLNNIDSAPYPPEPALRPVSGAFDGYRAAFLHEDCLLT
jgi:hypothetical protein